MYQCDVDTESKVIKFVRKFMHSDEKWTPKKSNDFLVPIMLYYAKSKGKNIISFFGGDYGGSDEYVVHDISRYVTLKSLWIKANTK
jgi:hypothetical protein